MHLGLLQRFAATVETISLTTCYVCNESHLNGTMKHVLPEYFYIHPIPLEYQVVEHCCYLCCLNQLGNYNKYRNIQVFGKDNNIDPGSIPEQLKLYGTLTPTEYSTATDITRVLLSNDVGSTCIQASNQEEYLTNTENDCMRARYTRQEVVPEVDMLQDGNEYSALPESAVPRLEVAENELFIMQNPLYARPLKAHILSNRRTQNGPAQSGGEMRDSAQRMEMDVIRCDIREEVQADESTLGNCLAQWSNRVLKHAPFWYAQRVDLLAICLQYRSPTMFCTFTAADLYWLVLHQLIEKQCTLGTGEQESDYTTLLPSIGAAR
ncbi:hypothetical protein L873DRAFT_1865286 [Choiromyces venosus 120613-1]|uniref:Uncharacterized protein n=1 Tax=Choiromyces venosus 120613-1 TaxID=1336337 RepID=A0A3N4J1N4_9PEZI|nr:hypothetical protein L873DRAFT_1865286 [Choiromyces venosus 120613-1]